MEAVSPGTPRQNEPRPEKVAKRHPVWRFCKYLSGFVLLLLCGCTGFACWVCMSASGQSWLAETVNSALVAKNGGLGVRITHLSGTLPFDFALGLELSDGKGIWLRAPDNRFTLNWRKLPGVVDLTALQLADVDVSRLPELPPSPEPAEPSRPLTLEDMQQLAAKTADFLAAEHWWLPEVRISGVELVNMLLPAGLLPGNGGTVRPRVDAGFEAGLASGAGEVAFTGRVGGDKGLLELPSFELAALNASLNLDIAPRKEGKGLDLAARFRAQAENPGLDVAQLPASLLGEAVLLDLRLDLMLDTSGSPSVELRLAGPDLQADCLNINGKGHWRSGPGWANAQIDGPVDYELTLDARPVSGLPADSPLAILRSPARLALQLAGNMPEINLDLAFECAKLLAAGHEISDVSARIGAPGLALPLDGDAMRLLLREQDIPVRLAAAVDGDKVNLAATAWCQAIGAEGAVPMDWRAGLRELSLEALGVAASGNLEALLLRDHDPAVNGGLKIALADWQALEKFMPGMKPAGDLKIDLELEAGEQGQAANLRLAAKEFLLGRDTGESIVELHDLTLDAGLADAFVKRVINARLVAGKISASGFNLSARVAASGPVAGPIQASLQTSGDAQAELEAGWSPGEAILRKLRLEMDASRLDRTLKKPLSLGVRSTGEARITYGEQGLGVHNLDIAISPSGRLRANGGLSPDRLDLGLVLDRLDFKPWQALAAQIPQGSADIHLSLSGTPARPGGKFNIDLREVAVPGSPLAPMSVSIDGNIVNAGAQSALSARLDLDPETLKALGSESANISARIPLTFASNGVPGLNMSGPLEAKVRWEGSLGPVWKLLPIADRRLNGRLNIDAAAGGTLQKPLLRGNVKVSKARYEDVQLGILLTDIGLGLELADRGHGESRGAPDSLPGSVNLSLHASDGRGGSVDVNGVGAIDGNDLDIKAKIDRLRPLRRRDVHIELSGNATVTGTAMAPVVDGEIIVNQGEVLLNNLAFTGSVTTLDITNPDVEKTVPGKGPEADAGDHGKLNVRINMLPRFTVEGRGLTSTWKAGLLVGGTPVEPRITGDISVVKGNFDFLGKNFVLTRGVVFFGGGSLANPLLDIDMTNETPDLTAHILLAGPVNKMQLTMTSDPTMPRDEILSRVLFGKSVSDLSRAEALQLGMAVAQLAGFGSGGELLGFAKKALGVDVLRLGTTSDAAGEPGESTADGTTVEMGKYLTDRIYMGVQQGFAADSTAFIIQLELTPHTNLEVRTEQNNTWGGLKWSLNY